jgi:hypothetical protein
LYQKLNIVTDSVILASVLSFEIYWSNTWLFPFIYNALPDPLPQCSKIKNCL